MALPTFDRAVATQNITVNTAYSLSVPYTGATQGWVEGDIVTEFGFSHSFTATHLIVKGTPPVEKSNLQGVLKLKNAEGTVSLPVIFNVGPAAPVFGTLPNNIPLYLGQQARIHVPVTNTIANLSVKGPWLQSTLEVVDGGIDILADVPSATQATLNMPAEARRFIVEVSNNGGSILSPKSKLNFTLNSGSPPALGTVSGSLSGSTLTFSWSAVSGALGYEYTLESGNAATWTFTTSTSFTATYSGSGNVTARVRVASPWIGTESTFTVGVPDAPTLLGGTFFGGGNDLQYRFTFTAPANKGSAITHYSATVFVTADGRELAGNTYTQAQIDGYGYIPVYIYTPLNPYPCTVKIRAQNAIGWSDYSNAKTIQSAGSTPS